MTDLHADELLENTRPIKAVLACVGTALVVLGLAYGGGYWRGATVTAQRASQKEAHALQQADQAKGEADALKVQAAKKDAEIAAKEHGLADAREKVARSDREVERLREASTGPDPAPSTGDNASQPIPPPMDLAPMVAALKRANQDKADLIKALETRSADLTLSRDLHKARADAAERESMNLRAANAAKDGLIKAAELRGFRNGFICGAITGGATGGYAGYRIGRIQ